MKTKHNQITLSVVFFLLLSIWTTIPYGATGDMDYHMASIWCAWGEKPNVCEDIEVGAKDEAMQFRNNASAEVPFMFQMCDSRNIDFWPYCEFDTNHPDTQRLRIAPPEHMSLYYRLVHVLIGENVQLSVLKIRLFNSLIASMVLFSLLTLTTNRIRFAVATGLTFSLIPHGIQHFSGVTTRGWAILGVMSSWAFLGSYLLTPKDELKLRRFQLVAFSLSVFLALSSRLDALLMVAITSLLTIFAFRVSRHRVNYWQVLLGFLGIATLGVVSQFLPIIKDYANLKVPEIYGTYQYLLFQLVHVPEFVADWWSYNIGQSGSGPGIVGLIGVCLFVISIAFALQKSNFFQRLLFLSFTTTVFLLLMKTSSVAGVIVPLSGFYTLGMAVPWLGLSVATSKNDSQFMSSIGNRRTSTTLLGFSHSVYFYTLLEFYTRRGKNLGYFETLSLNDVWWWDIAIGPNVVFLIGASLFPLFLITLWRSIPLSFPVK